MPADDQDSRNGRNGEEDPRYTRHLGAREQPEENQDWVHSDSCTHQSGAENVILENAIANNEKQYPQQMRIVGKSCDDDDDEGGQQRPEHGDELEERRYGGEQQRIGDADTGEKRRISRERATDSNRSARM